MVTAAALIFLMMVMMLVMVVVTAAALIFLMMVMMLVVVVMTAAALIFLMVVMMLVVVVMTAAAFILIMVMMVMMCMLFLQLSQFCCKSCLAVHCLQQLLAGQFTPGGCYNGSLCIMLPEHSNCSIQLCLRNGIRTGQDNGRSSFHLVVVEFTEVLHIDLYLTGIHNCHSITQGNRIAGNLVYGTNNVRQLAYTRGLNDDPVGSILLNNLSQRLAEVTHQRAANAARIHLGNVDTSILQESAVNTDFTKFVFNQDQFLALIGLLNHFLDQSGLAGSQKAAVNINFRHIQHLLLKIIYLVL